MSRKTGFAALDQLHQRMDAEHLLPPLWPEGDGVALLDQTKLPFERTILHIRTAEAMSTAIREMRIRGSGAIGCAGALGAYLAVRRAPAQPQAWDQLTAPLRQARPTAVALALAVDEVLNAARAAPATHLVEWLSE